MLIDAAAAKALAAIILISTQGADALNSQLPLRSGDHGNSWLVVGRPYTDKRRGFQYCFSHIIIRKFSAEVVAIGSDVRMILTDAEKKHWHQIMTPDQFDSVFGPRTSFEEGGQEFAENMLMNSAVYGGLINTQKDAAAYAHVLMQTNPELALIPKTSLRVGEHGGVWRVTVYPPGDHGEKEIMSFSRRDGRIVAGSL